MLIQKIFVDIKKFYQNKTRTRHFFVGFLRYKIASKAMLRYKKYQGDVNYLEALCQKVIELRSSMCIGFQELIILIQTLTIL